LSLSSSTNTTRQTDGELLELFPHHPRFSEVVLHHRWIIQTPKRPLQPQSIPPVQYPDHIVLVTFYECSPHLVLQQIVSVCSHASHLHHGSAYVTLVAAFAALGSLRLIFFFPSLPSFVSWFDNPRPTGRRRSREM